MRKPNDPRKRLRGPTAPVPITPEVLALLRECYAQLGAVGVEGPYGAELPYAAMLLRDRLRAAITGAEATVAV